MRHLETITKDEAKELLEYVYPNTGYTFIEVKPKADPPDENGASHVTFNFRPIVGVIFSNGQDRCVLHFDHSEAVLWLYRAGFDVEPLLEFNHNMTEVEEDFDALSFTVYSVMGLINRKGNEVTTEAIHKTLSEAYQKYVVKE